LTGFFSPIDEIFKGIRCAATKCITHCTF